MPSARTPATRGSGTGEPDGPHRRGEPTAALAAAYRRRLLHLAARDLTGAVTVDEVGDELADIAAAVAGGGARRGAGRAAARRRPRRLAVVAMGKCGGRELNYASDVDVIFVAEPVKDEDETAALATASRLAARLIGVCARSTPEGSIFPVDPNLRPEGRAGPLVRTLASHLAYYERWAKTWEFQALLKARPVAGDLALGQAYADALGPMVWQAARREHFVEDVQAMRRRVEQSLPARPASSSWVPAACGTSSSRSSCCSWCTAAPTRRCARPTRWRRWPRWPPGGYVGRDDAAELDGAYRFLRQVEHLLQLYRLRRTHTLPEDPDAAAPGPGVRTAGRAAAMVSPRYRRTPTRRPSSPSSGASTPARCGGCTRSCSTGRCYAVARLPVEEARLTPAAAAGPAGGARVRRPGRGAAPHRGADRGRLPARGHPADAAAGAARLVRRPATRTRGCWLPPGERRARRHAVVSAAAAGRDQAAERMARVLASAATRPACCCGRRKPSRCWPTTPSWPASSPSCGPREASAVRRHGRHRDGGGAVRALRRRELFRIAVADLLGLMNRPDAAGSSEALSAVTAATVRPRWTSAIRKVEAERRRAAADQVRGDRHGTVGGRSLLRQ